MLSDVTRVTEGTRARERRYRRSDDITQALAFQCAHVQQSMGLEAVVVSDDSGDRWVGAGESRLCTLLARGAADLTTGSDDAAAIRMKALQAISADLQAERMTTSVFSLPNRNQQLHIIGVGTHERRADAVLGTAGGARRILGITGRRSSRTADPHDGEAILRRAVEDEYFARLRAGSLDGPLPQRRFGQVQDQVYRETLDAILEPAMEILLRSGIVASLGWGAWRARDREVQLGPERWVRALHFQLKGVRSGARMGRMIVEFEHEHARFNLPAAPQLFLRWDR